MKFNKFENEIGKVGRKHWFFSDNDDYYLARSHMRKFADEIVDYFKFSTQKLSILEVGPSQNLYQEKCEEISTNVIGIEALKIGHNYKTLDIAGNADYICSVEEMSSNIHEKFDVIILLGIIEHVANIHVLCDQFDHVLNKNGIAFVNTPFMFKVHGPIPDYWRISEYGYKHLFDKKFNLDFDVFPQGELGKNSIPLSFNVKMTKK